MWHNAYVQMDYLDPKKKRAKKTRLMIGYALLGIALAIATVIFYYLVNGYYIDSEGEVIQNGLVFIDSKPESAKVFLNGEEQRNRTDIKLVVPEGEYEVVLQRDGYRSWSRSLNLEGGSLRQLTYARLIPDVIDNEVALTIPSMPDMTDQSIDKRWMIMSFADNPYLMSMIDLDNDPFVLDDIALPLDIVAEVEGASWRIVDWVDDSRTFLAKYSLAGSGAAEYVIIDREAPLDSVNLSAVIDKTQVYNSVRLRDRKRDRLFLHSSVDGLLYSADLSGAAPVLIEKDVIQYEPYGDGTILYATKFGSKAGFIKIILLDGDKKYTLREIKEDTNDEYLLEIARLGNAYVIGIGSKTENRVIVYNDPINALKQNDFSDIPVPTTVLRVDSPEELTISSDASVIMVRSGQKIASHEFKADRSYSFTLDNIVDADQEMAWLDGQHITYSSAGVRNIFDFDGSNQYDLIQSDKNAGVFYDRNIDFQFGFAPSDDGLTVNIMRAFMRTEADR